MKDNKEKKFKLNISSILVIAIFSLCILFMVVNLVVQRNHKLMYIFGYSYSVVPTQSMEPVIERDDVVLIKNKSYGDVHVDPEDGDIIVYYNSELKIFVIHRAIAYFPDGSIQTKGDNNAASDTIHVTEELYRGTASAWGECLGLGKLVNNGRNILFAVVVFALCFFMISEIVDVVKAIINKAKEQAKKDQELTEEEMEKERERLRQEVMKELMNNKDDK